MTKVQLDLSNDENLKFAIYITVFEHRGEFTVDDIIRAFREKYDYNDTERLEEVIKSLLKIWVDSGAIYENLNSFSVFQH